jgi:hypothetical protein
MKWASPSRIRNARIEHVRKAFDSAINYRDRVGNCND